MHDPAILYHLLNYPTPQDVDRFGWLVDPLSSQDVSPPLTQRSRATPPSALMQEYCDFIGSYQWLFKSLPFVEQIYLCNSITFNALNDVSDIDVLIVTKPQRLWLARAWSLVCFALLRIKRFGSNKTKKFCLSFYVDREHTNLYSIALQPYDIYLCYWIAHLVPIYSANTSYIDQIYQDNRRISNFIPHIHLGQNIYLPVPLTIGENGFKRVMEYLSGGPNRVAHLRTNLIKALWLPLLYYKSRKLGAQGRGIIISDTMLKFYHDKRKRINYQYHQHITPHHSRRQHQDESLF